MKLIITRPGQDAQPLAQRLALAGHESILLPLLKIVPRAGVKIPDGQWQAICLTSANGIRSLASVEGIESCRILAVGPQSAKAATEKGCMQVEIRGPDVKGLTHFILGKLKPEGGPLLYISGEVTSGDMQQGLRTHGFDVHHLVTYDAVPLKPDAIADTCRIAHGVLHYSPRSAELWQHMAAQAETHHLVHFCLSQAVASRLPASVRKMIAKTPDDAGMLALLESAGEAA